MEKMLLAALNTPIHEKTGRFEARVLLALYIAQKALSIRALCPLLGFAPGSYHKVLSNTRNLHAKNLVKLSEKDVPKPDAIAVLTKGGVKIVEEFLSSFEENLNLIY